jgi:hypothetical protein
VTLRLRDAGILIAGFLVALLIWSYWVGRIPFNRYGESDESAPPVSPLVGNIENDLSAMVTGADHYLRSGKKVDLAPYTRGWAALPKDMAALSVWGVETGASVKPQVTAVVEAAQDESQVIQAMVASTGAGHLTFGAKLARALDEQLPRVRVSFEQAKLALEGGSP